MHEIMQCLDILIAMDEITILLKRIYRLYSESQSLSNDLYLSVEPMLTAPYNYLREKNGKKIRIVMAIIVNQLFEQSPNQTVLRIGELIQLLHCASLIIDDIEDSSKLRRGDPCSHIIYGIGLAANSANLMYFLPFKSLLQKACPSHLQPSLSAIFLEEMICCHIGQAEDVRVHKAISLSELPTLEQYLRMTSAKTGSLLRMLVALIGALLDVQSQTVQALTLIMDWVGISFQITDDILNLTTDIGKGVVAEDLHQKKFTLIVHHMRENEQFMRLFFQVRKSQEEIGMMLRLVSKTEAVQKCSTIAKGYAEKAMQAIDSLNCPRKEGLQDLKSLIKFIVDRRK